MKDIDVMAQSNLELLDIIDCIDAHDKAAKTRIDLVASNAWTSRWSRQALGSTLCNNYSIGHPGQRLYGGCKEIDRLEEIVHELAKDIFQTNNSCIQLLSGMQANTAAYDALIQPGDSVITTPCRNGGHYSHNKDGPLRLYRPRLHSIPFDDSIYNIDVQGLHELIRKEQPKLLVVGWSEFLFPHPLWQMREICNRYGTRIMYDMSHVAGLIAGGEFQADAGRLADIVTSSTGKSLHAPDHGLCLYNDDRLTEPINRAVQPLLTSNTHPHEIAALGIALIEMKTFGKDYAKQVIQNAKSLGHSLAKRGVQVLYSAQGYTESHTILVQLNDTRSKDYVRVFDQAGITVNRCALPWDKEDEESGLRLGTQVVTRRGMKEQEMEKIAEAISSVIIEGLTASEVFHELVKPLAKEFDGTAYTFDEDIDPLRTKLTKRQWLAQAKNAAERITGQEKQVFKSYIYWLADRVRKCLRG